MLMLVSGTVVVVAAEVSVADVPVVNAGSVGGTDVVAVGGAVVAIGAV